MTASFRCCITNQRLSILDYDEKKTNGRFRALVNEDKMAVIQLQAVETADTPLSQLSLCPGILESSIPQLLSSSPSTNYLTRFCIEKLDEDIVYR